MRITLNQIEAFYWIVQLGSFRAAASRLNLTQPTISLRVRSLEEALGITLFETQGRRCRPTVESARLVLHAERLLRIASDMHSRGTDYDPLSGYLRLGAPDSFGLTCMPELLRSLRLQYPDIRVAVTIDNSKTLSEKLNSRDLDVAFLVEPTVDSHIHTEALGDLEHGWVASPALGLPSSVLRPEHLAEQEIFTNPEPSNLMSMVRGWFSRSGVEPTRISTCNSLSVVLHLTKAGAGISLLPLPILAAEKAQGTLRVLRTRPPVVSPRLHGAYQVEKIGRSVLAVMDAARQVIDATSLLRRRQAAER